MLKRIYSLIPISLIVLSGCAGSQLIRSVGSSDSLYAPLNERQMHGGTIKYLSDFNRSQRRQGAYKKMHDSCNGDYKITKEHTEKEDASFENYYSHVWYSSNDEYIYVDFECAN